MSQEQTQDTEKKNKRVRKLPNRRKRGDETQTSVRLGHKLHNEILDIAESSRLSFADAMRLLLHMGKDQYKLNNKAGITTKAKRQQHKAKQEAEAMAKAAERERRKNSKKSDVIVAATPMLFRPDDEE